jgi:heme A synthase
MLDTVAKLTLAIGLIILVAALGPWLVIWSLNTLFPVLAIEFTFWTWCAVVILAAVFRANVTVKRKN